jgi:hypothetical protein
MIERDQEYAFKGMLGASDELAPALIRAVLDVFPVLGPLLAPFESPATAQTNLRLKAVFGLWGFTHDSSIIRPKRQLLDNPS